MPITPSCAVCDPPRTETLRAWWCALGCILCIQRVGGLLVAGEASEEAFHVPTHIFAGDARGPFQTGTFEELWIDRQRSEPDTADPTNRRHLMVQVWYPAVFKGDPQRAPYSLHRELYPNDADEAWLDAAGAVRTTSVEQARLAPAPARFPVLIYNPGALHPHFSATFQTEFLASHGYVVVAVGHTGINRIERFPDRYEYKPTVKAGNTDNPADSSRSEMERFQQEVAHIATVLMPVQVQDICFVLDQLGKMDETRGNRFYHRLDLDAVGALGWSLGGALSLQASHDEPRIKAAANLDGWLYADVADSGTHRPVLVMHGDAEFARRPQDSAANRELNLVGNSLRWKMLARTDADWYDLTLRHTPHLYFSDRSLLEPADPQNLYPRLAHDIMNAYTLEFFDKYLRHRTDAPLLSGEASYPDADLVKKIVPQTAVMDDRAAK